MVLGERQVEIPWVVNQLQKTSGSCLDVGSAGADYLLDLKDHGRNVTRLDQNKIPEDGFSTIIAGDIRSVGFSDKFDTVMFISSLEHVGLSAYGFIEKDTTDPVEIQRLAFERAFSFVKNDGIMIVTLPFGCFENSGWYITYTREMVDALIGAKEVICENYFTLDKETWTYNEVPRHMCPLEGQDWPRANFSRAATVCCLVLKKSAKKMYGNALNLGCGITILGDYMNVDMIGDNPAVIKQNFINYLERCPTDSVKHILMSHSFEHIPLSYAGVFLQNCMRVLSNGGVLDIVCPNSKWAMEQYINGSFDYNTINMWMHANQLNPYDVHMWVSDEAILSKLVTDVGFSSFKITLDQGCVALKCIK